MSPLDPATQQPITADQGWRRLLRALGVLAPRNLSAAGKASAGLAQLRRRG